MLHVSLLYGYFTYLHEIFFKYKVREILSHITYCIILTNDYQRVQCRIDSIINIRSLASMREYFKIEESTVVLCLSTISFHYFFPFGLEQANDKMGDHEEQIW